MSQERRYYVSSIHLWHSCVSKLLKTRGKRYQTSVLHYPCGKRQHYKGHLQIYNILYFGFTLPIKDLIHLNLRSVKVV